MHDFTIAALQGALSTGLTMTMDILGAANQCARAAGAREARWRIVGWGDTLTLANGLSIATDRLSSRTRIDGSVLVIPGLRLTADNAKGDEASPIPYLSGRVAEPDAQQVAAIAARHHERGHVVTGSCSSVLLLGEAGLLDGRRATTHWCLTEMLRLRYPACELDTTRMVIEDDRVITAGGAMAHMDIMLCLVRRHYGERITEQVMRYLLLDHRPTQSTYAAWAHLAMRDPLVARLETLVEEQLPQVPSVEHIADALHVSARTLARRVQHATGQSPKALIQAIRLRHARYLLETTTLPLPHIAERVGYSDTSGLHRLAAKITRCAPGRLRPGA